MDAAFRRCKMPAQTIAAEHISIATDALYLMLSSWANDGAPLWCIEKQVYPLYEGVPRIITDIGTVDIHSANLRTLQRVTGSDTTAPDSIMTEFTSATPVTSVGVFWGAPAVEIALERSDDGATWQTVQIETPTAGAGERTWFDLTDVLPSLYFRVRATGGTLGTPEIYLGNMPSEIPMSRMNFNDYTSLPNKTFQTSAPLQYWLDREARQPVMRLWPVPNAAGALKQAVIHRHRHIMDPGTMQQEVEVPQRWYDAVVAGLAARLANEVVEVDAALIPILESKALIALKQAREEERDKSPIRMAPNIRAYTA